MAGVKAGVVQRLRVGDSWDRSCGVVTRTKQRWRAQSHRFAAVEPPADSKYVETQLEEL